jgi:hypothetical protein
VKLASARRRCDRKPPSRQNHVSPLRKGEAKRPVTFMLRLERIKFRLTGAGGTSRLDADNPHQLLLQSPPIIKTFRNQGSQSRMKWTADGQDDGQDKGAC